MFPRLFLFGQHGNGSIQRCHDGIVIHHLARPIQYVQGSAAGIVTCECRGGVGGEDAIDHFGTGPTADGGVEGKFAKVGFCHGGFGVGGEEGVDYYGRWLASACLMQRQSSPNTPRKHRIFRPRTDHPYPRLGRLFFHPITNLLPLGILHKHEQFRRSLFIRHFLLFHDPRRRRWSYRRRSSSCTISNSSGYRRRNSFVVGNSFRGGRPSRTAGSGIVSRSFANAVIRGFIERLWLSLTSTLIHGGCRRCRRLANVRRIEEGVDIGSVAAVARV
mmetsp:Transcript_20953/g.37841  ORF Transcript_20953/g.37841 Transcript_20953/m.37841 type:complete len:274 (+) Transcript_20953:1010-1831(+)